jgi:hypothetical protein
MSKIKRQFGFIQQPDDRDNLFPVSSMLLETPFITEKYWWADGWWGDQGSTSQCVCYSWAHWIEDGPVVQDKLPTTRSKPLYDPEKFYKACQDRDEWPGNSYSGTSVRAAAKILKELNVIKEYRWASNITDVSNAILNLGPMVVGTKWYTGMDKPNSQGYVSATGTQMGGHAYVLNGVDTIKKVFRIKNSWGKRWGQQGYAFIRFNDFAKLLADGGTACIAFENKLSTIPLLESLSPPTSP